MIVLSRLVLVLIACLLGGGAAEGLLRAGGYQYSPVKIGASVRNDFREQHAFHDRHVVYDRDLIWRPIAGLFSPFNPQGFRGAPVNAIKTPGTFRIIALGDSNTFGWDVDEGANWPSQLQHRFANSPRRTEVINAGVWGYTSYQGLRRFNEMLALNPDLVLVSFGANDAHQVTVSDAAYVKSHDRIDRLTRLTRRLRLAQLAVAAWDRVNTLAADTGTLVPRVTLEDYASHLRAIVRTARERGIRVVLLTRPFVGSSTDPAFWKMHAPAYNAVTVDMGRTENVPVIDVYDAFRDRADCFDDEAHFGVEGHRAAAELIHARLSSLIDQS